MQDPVTVLFDLGLGPWAIALRGKIPVFDAWNTRPPVDEATVRGWLASGYNLGLRTGLGSGAIVIDDDRPKHGLEQFDLPPTGLMVQSPTGSRHAYYLRPAEGECPRNSASLLAPKVDVRGEGGYVVIPPSIHPDARKPYVWVSTGLATPFPVALLATATEARRGSKSAPVEPHGAPTGPFEVDMTAPTGGAGYANAALFREAHAVRTAPEGSRNDTLNRAAFSLGQLVAGGVLQDGAVRSELASAAVMSGLTEREATKTIESGIAAGAKTPRTAPPPRSRSGSAPSAVAPSAVGKQDVTVPGSHVFPGGEYVEQGSDTFAVQVIAALPGGLMYRRAGQLGEIHAGEFIPFNVERLRSAIDAGVRLVASKPGKDEDDEPTISFRPCARDYAAVVMAYGQVHGPVRQLAHLATHPVCVGSDFELARPGWNEKHGVYLTSTIAPESMPLEFAKAVLEDLVCDFPFQSNADRANYFGLLLTPLLRPAINEPVPMHLIGSPIERSGKTKLAEIVLGIVIAGHRIPAMQLGEREEEREKRIMSVLLRGQTLLHLDNLSEFLDSPSLASLLTSSEYQGRMLGSSSAPTVPNGLTVVGTGNNVHATGEISKRIVPIRLLPPTETPETRQDFRHPDLLAYVTTERARVLGALVGLLDHWRAQGRPLHRAGFGGFERWTAVVGGILTAAGYPEWLTNMAEWRGVTDDSGQEHKTLIDAWSEKYQGNWIASKLVFELATDLDLYGWLDRNTGDRAKRTAFGVKVLNRIVGRVFGTVRVESDGVGSRRRVRLVAV